MPSPTQRSLDLMRKRGFTVQVVEKWIPQARRRVDLFGFGDVIAMHPESGTVLVQTTSASNMAARVKKISAEPRHRTWLLAGRGWHRIEVHGWRKDKTGKWVCRTVEVGL